jgi:hypothetical protein
VNTGRFSRSARSRSYHADRRVEPLVLASEISGLSRLNALLKVDNLVVPFSFPYLAPVKTQPGFIPRESTARVVEIGKRPSKPSAPPAQEIKPREPEKSKDIAAGQEPYFQ